MKKTKNYTLFTMEGIIVLGIYGLIVITLVASPILKKKFGKTATEIAKQEKLVAEEMRSYDYKHTVHQITLENNEEKINIVIKTTPNNKEKEYYTTLSIYNNGDIEANEGNKKSKDKNQAKQILEKLLISVKKDEHKTSLDNFLKEIIENSKKINTKKKIDFQIIYNNITEKFKHNNIPNNTSLIDNANNINY